MSEKGDMPGDTVSLPPTYAPSEAFTDSPPPAYRGAKSSRVQIVKLLCVTVVVSAFIIGFFILTSNYLNARACQCPQEGLELHKLKAAGFFELPKASSLVGLEGNHLEEEVVNGEGKQLEEEKKEPRELEGEVMDGNDLDNGDDTTLPKMDIEVVGDVPTEEVDALVEEVVEAERELERELVREEAEEEALQDVLSAQMDHMKKIRLPIDLILGNPALAGRDVDCEVERRQQPLGRDILGQAIIVTCHDNEDISLPIQNNRGPVPPLSILAPIMKMLSARPSPIRPSPCSPNNPCFPIPSPNMMFEGRTAGPMTIRGPMPFLAPHPRFSPLPRKDEDGPRNKMLPIHLQPLLRMSPRVPRLLTPPKPFPSPMPQSFPNPMSLASLRRGALPLPQPRAVQDPISLPGLRLRPMPFLPQSFNVVRGIRRDDRPITHMEMNAPPPRSPPTPSRPNFSAPRQALKEFGPPRIHTVLNSAQPQKPQFRGPINQIRLPDNIRIQTSSPQKPPQFRGPFNPIHLPDSILIQTKPMPKDIMTPPKPIAILPQPAVPIAGPIFPPPPRFDPNGKRGTIREINADAEIIVKDLPRELHPQPSHSRPSPPPQPSHSRPSPPPQPSHSRPSPPQFSHSRPSPPQFSHTRLSPPQFSQTRPSPPQIFHSQPSPPQPSPPPHPSHSQPSPPPPTPPQSTPLHPSLPQPSPLQAQRKHHLLLMN